MIVIPGCYVSNVFDVCLSCYRYDKVRLQRLQQKKLDRQEAEMEKEMFIGNESMIFMNICHYRGCEGAALSSVLQYKHALAK